MARLIVPKAQFRPSKPAASLFDLDPGLRRDERVGCGGQGQETGYLPVVSFTTIWAVVSTMASAVSARRIRAKPAATDSTRLAVS